MSSESTVATRIRMALAQHLKRDVGKIHLEDNLRADLGLDSLAMIELLFKVEEAFDLEIPNDDLSKITTVGDVVAYVEERLGSTSPSQKKPGPEATTPEPVAAAAAPAPRIPTAASAAASAKRGTAAAKVAKASAATKKKGSRRA